MGGGENILESSLEQNYVKSLVSGQQKSLALKIEMFCSEKVEAERLTLSGKPPPPHP